MIIDNKTWLLRCLWLLALLPLLIAWGMAMFGIGLPQATKNHGALMPAGVKVPTALIEQHQGKWGLLMLSERCDRHCEQQLYRLQQLHKSLGKQFERLQPIWLSNEQFAERRPLGIEIDFDKVQRLSDDQLLAWFDQQNLDWRDQSMWLVDPQGFLVMRFPPQLTGRQILSDIQWLLKASRVG